MKTANNVCAAKHNLYLKLVQLTYFVHNNTTIFPIMAKLSSPLTVSYDGLLVSINTANKECAAKHNLYLKLVQLTHFVHSKTTIFLIMANNFIMAIFCA